MSDPYMSAIHLFAGPYAPVHWAFCNGQLLTIAQNQAVYSLVGTTFGGDAVTTFALPDCRGRVPIHRGTGIGLTPRMMGQMFGTETVTLSESQMPEHSHVMQGSTATAIADTPQGAYLATSDGYDAYAATTDTSLLHAMWSETCQPTGGSYGQTGAHYNIMPSLGLNFIFCLQGSYPSRN